jgi:hypothetical protein
MADAGLPPQEHQASAQGPCPAIGTADREHEVAGGDAAGSHSPPTHPCVRAPVSKQPRTVHAWAQALQADL